MKNFDENFCFLIQTSNDGQIDDDDNDLIIVKIDIFQKKEEDSSRLIFVIQNDN